GPCCLEVDRDQYQAWVKQAILILQGKTDGLRKELETAMEVASEQLRFEDAAAIRDRLQQLENFGTRQEMVSFGGENRDVFALYREEQLAVCSVLRVRNGRIDAGENFRFEQVEIPDDEILSAIITQYYRSGRDIPEEILLPLELESEEFIRSELASNRGMAVQFISPKRGLRFRLLGLAQLNAKEHFVSSYDREARYQEVAEALARLCGVQQMPRRIECLDISTLQGSDSVGAIVSFYDGEPDRENYRKYLLKSEGKPDDFESVAEVTRRRFRQGSESRDLPDLFVIDGGKGQLGRVVEVLEELEVSLDVVALAKIRDSDGHKRSAGAVKSGENFSVERLFVPGRREPITLPLQSASTHFLQRIRDEAHRYVIEFHRSRRGARASRSQLDAISGIGPERRKRLLKAFGSIRAIRDATADEVAKAGRMPLSLAEKILKNLK
ncbi:MAG: excinuclease ABC subunit C, partial [Bdellovibrionales bacterium]|nr:excinuclease ABC subunit C [Bdellovibrionales bacterium]